MNLCTQCKYRFGRNFDFCEHPINGVDPGWGGPKPLLCSMARSSVSGVCGPAGDLYEPVEYAPTIERVYQAWYIRLWNWIRSAF
jgi:hypothetical protein